MSLARTAVPAALAAVLALPGCALVKGGEHGTHSPKPSTAASAKPGDMTGGHHYRAGYFLNANTHVALDIHRVERYPTYSVLYLDVYALGKPAALLDEAGSGGLIENGFATFGLLDSTGGKYYHPLSAPDGTTFGSHMETPDNAVGEPNPGNRYVAQVYYPPLPASIQRITVITPGTTGEMTGIPVMNSGRSQAAVPPATRGKPKPGQPVFWEVKPPRGRIVSKVDDLHGHSEGAEKSDTRNGGEEKIGLRTDVLFAFNKANLSSKATSVLDDAIDQTRAQADPAKPPITITGYTDSKGSDAYNQKLSERRAAAVEKYMSAKLGTTYQYRATGRGEADPVAPNSQGGVDNPAGRAKNRRVEISYTIKNQKPDVTTTQTATPGPGSVSAPAAWRTSDGPVVGSKYTASGGTRVDVHPFYRDGAYMVGVLGIHSTNGGDCSTPSDLEGTEATDLTSDQAGIDDVIGSQLGAVVAYDPDSKTGYYVVRRGPNVAQTAGVTHFIETGGGDPSDSLISGVSDCRAFLYYPAPPAGVTKVDVLLGESVNKLGTVHNVPVE